MTPLDSFQKARHLFERGGFSYIFFVPSDMSLKYYTNKVREYARRNKACWRVAYYGKPRTWIIKQKTAKKSRMGL